MVKGGDVIQVLNLLLSLLDLLVHECKYLRTRRQGDGAGRLRRPGAQFTCFTGTNVQILTVQFACFTGTNIQIGTGERRRRHAALARADEAGARCSQLPCFTSTKYKC
jgi:hypothetical protein